MRVILVYYKGSRKRCFFIGVEDVVDKIGLNFMTMYQLYKLSDIQTTLGEAISDVVNEDEEELKFLRDGSRF